MPRHFVRSTPTPPTPATWILAADAGRARLFSAGTRNGRLTELADLVNPEARLSEHERVSDRRGRMGGGAGKSNAFEARESPERQSAIVFARRLCKMLGQGRRVGACNRIYVLAEPAFLGLLRRHLDPPTRRLVKFERGSDLVRRAVPVIRGALPQQL